MKHPETTSFISCDWGTSRLRLRAVAAGSMEIQGEAISECGVARTFEQWEKEGKGLSRIDFFAGVLRRELLQLDPIMARHTRELPLLCSGMASSSMGILELPYAALPFSLDGSGAITARVASEILPNPIFLISGVKSTGDVMRGEETELLGTAALSPQLPPCFLALLPGTHSKHIRVANNSIRGFDTFMTGEVFQLVSEHSTLRHSLHTREGTDFEFFDLGVEQAGRAPLLKNLFQVRANALLKGLTPAQNHSFLSGLLIGAELQAIRPEKSEKIVLLGNDVLKPLYARAWAHSGMQSGLIEIPEKVYDRSVLTGQWHIYQHQTQQK